MGDPERTSKDEGITLERRIVSVFPHGEAPVNEDGATLAVSRAAALLDGTLASPAFANNARSAEPSSSDARTTDPGISVANQQRIGDRYEILGFVGAGGMGSVYRARDLELDEVVALKVLSREIVNAPGVLERFRREVKLARRVTHRNVARVFDIGEHQGEKFLTMEFVDGESLTRVIEREHPLSLTRALSILEGICAGLSAAHGAGVVHRDLKPDNVLIAKDARIVITDFGIARASVDAGGAGQTMGMLLGTPAYMAPEQVEGWSNIDARADIYALGALMFELFTGRRAWPGDSPLVVASARLVSAPPDPRSVRAALPPRCAEIVLRAMARRREDRYASVGEVASDLATVTVQPVVEVATRAASSPSAPPSPAHGSGARQHSPGTLMGSCEKSVAVLPFRNAGGAEDQYLADELTDDLIDGLSMTRGLRVCSRGMVTRFKGADLDPREVGRELGVNVVVEGSVRRARGSVRVSTRLVCVTDGIQIWAKRFDKPEHDVLSINDEAARASADALILESKAPSREAPKSPMAVDLYLRGRHEYRQFWPEHQRRALELFAQAESFSPGDPVILAAKAMSMARMSFFTNEGAEAARAAAEQAVAAAPDLAEAHLALGSALFQIGEWVGAARELKQAVMRGPGLAEAHASLGRLLAEVGELNEAIRRLEAALSLDPQVPVAMSVLSRTYALMGDWARLDQILEEVRRQDGENTYWTHRARMMLWRRDADMSTAMLAEFEKHDESLGKVTKMLLRLISTGKMSEEFEAYRREMLASTAGARRRSFLFQVQAETSAYVGDDDISLEMMRMSAEAGLIDLAWMDRCPLFTHLHGDPRFLAARAVVARRVDEILAAYHAA